MNKFWEEFLDKNPDIAKKLAGLPLCDPIIEMVDDSLQAWMAKKRDTIFEFTSERREKLIQIAKASFKYEFISETPFYQYIRAYVLHLYHWELELQKNDVANGLRERVDYNLLLDDIIFDAFLLGYSMRTTEPRKKKG